MSGKLKEVRTRITSVTSTQQITKAMKMVSAAKLRRAQDAILQMRPYAIKNGQHAGKYCCCKPRAILCVLNMQTSGK